MDICIQKHYSDVPIKSTVGLAFRAEKNPDVQIGVLMNSRFDRNSTFVFQILKTSNAVAVEQGSPGSLSSRAPLFRIYAAIPQTIRQKSL